MAILVEAASQSLALSPDFFPQKMPKSLFFMYTYIQIPFTIMLLINATSNNNANVLCKGVYDRLPLVMHLTSYLSEYNSALSDCIA